MFTPVSVVEIAGRCLRFSLPNGLRETESHNSAALSPQQITAALERHVAPGSHVVVISPRTDGNSITLREGTASSHITLHSIRPGSGGMRFATPLQAVAAWLAGGQRASLHLNPIGQHTTLNPAHQHGVVCVQEWPNNVTVITAGVATSGEVFVPAGITAVQTEQNLTPDRLREIVNSRIVQLLMGQCQGVAVHITTFVDGMTVADRCEALISQSVPHAATTRPVWLFVDPYAVAAGAELMATSSSAL